MIGKGQLDFNEAAAVKPRKTRAIACLAFAIRANFNEAAAVKPRKTERTGGGDAAMKSLQ